jgi:AcrR family transcriptional regulator
VEIRDRIIAAFRELALTRGFYGTTMDEVAGRAGISKRTLYRYFRSKEEVIEAVLDRFMADVSREAEEILDSDDSPTVLMTKIVKYLSSHGRFITSQRGLEDLRQHFPHLWQKIDAFRAQRARVTIDALLKKGNTEILKDVDPRIITAVVVASFQAVLNPDFILENGLTFEETARQLSILLMGGLSSEREEGPNNSRTRTEAEQ